MAQAAPKLRPTSMEGRDTQTDLRTFDTGEARGLGLLHPLIQEICRTRNGELFRSMGCWLLRFRYDSLYTDSSIAEEIDCLEGTSQVWGIEGDTHIEDYFDLYDPEGNTLGLTEESFETLRDDMVNSVLTQLKAYING